MIRMQLNGLKEAREAIERFGERVADFIEDALDETADAVQGHARARVPGSIGEKVRVRRRGRLETGVEAQDYRARFYEFGTAPHRIKPRRKKALRFEAGGEVFAAGVQHPGQPARPFMVPATEQERGRFEHRVADALRDATR